MALSAVFNRAFQRLASRLRRYHQAPRSPEAVRELAARRADLEDARMEMADVRKGENWQYPPPRVSPRYVDPAIGSRPASRLELAGVAIGGLLLVGAVGFGLLYLAGQLTDTGDHLVALEEGSVDESLDYDEPGRCRWTVDFALSADGADAVSIQNVHTTRTHPSFRNTPDSLVRSGPLAGTQTFRLVYVFSDCPYESAHEIEHGRLQVSYSTPEIDTRTARFDF